MTLKRWLRPFSDRKFVVEYNAWCFVIFCGRLLTIRSVLCTMVDFSVEKWPEPGTTSYLNIEKTWGVDTYVTQGHTCKVFACQVSFRLEQDILSNSLFSWHRYFRLKNEKCEKWENRQMCLKKSKPQDNLNVFFVALVNNIIAASG